MKHIRILHLYSNALDLYGDYKNLTVLQRRIAETGNTSDITEINLDEVIDPTGYDFVYIGHGKARNLAAVAPHFVQYGDTIRTAIEGGQVWFVTGNARELFGQRFTTPTGETMPGIGLFDYTGVETDKVFVSDMLAQPVYDENARIYGFINRTAYLVGENRYPLFTVLSGCGDGETPDGKEGTLYHNFFATWAEREEVASFVNTTVQGLVTFTITVTNSEGKPQPNITLQIKPGNEVKTFKTNAEGKATIEVDMTTPKYVSLDVSSPKSSKHQSLLLSANKPNVTAIFDTDDDIAAYIKAGKQIRIKLQISNNDNQQLAGVELISSSTNAKATTNAHGEAQLTVGVGETIAINHKGYQEGKFTVKELCPIKDMENPELVRLLLVGEDPVYQIADNMPEFPGGMTACLQYLARNIKYPVTAQKEGAQGKVIVQMVIEKDGSVDHVSIVRSITPELDAEAARVVKSMPKWKPATVKDKAVRCRYTVPVTFKLQ